MKKLIISAILALNLCADSCTTYSNHTSKLVETEIEYLGNKLDNAFCANYEITLSLLIATKNECKNTPKLYEVINQLFQELNKAEYRTKCKLN